MFGCAAHASSRYTMDMLKALRYGSIPNSINMYGDILFRSLFGHIYRAWRMPMAVHYFVMQICIFGLTLWWKYKYMDLVRYKYHEFVKCRFSDYF